MGSLSFNTVFLNSAELTNAFLDYKLSLAWDFDHDVVFILNLDDIRLIEYLTIRGQKRFVVAGGSLDVEKCDCVRDIGGLLFKLKKTEKLKKPGYVPVLGETYA